MTAIGLDRLPPETVGLRLCKMFPGDELRLCEGVRFTKGRPAVNTVLRRAAIAGRVEVSGKNEDHWADVLDDSGDLIETVALDADSFRSLKNHWMRCKYEGSLNA
jgi:hypothetical protein